MSRLRSGQCSLSGLSLRPDARIHELAELLDRYDVGSEIVTSERPGYVIYEDDAQIIAEPFRDTRT